MRRWFCTPLLSVLVLSLAVCDGSSASSPPSRSAPRPSIRLSTGVALAQTGPDGTLMSFSVDYEFTAGEPDPKGCIWVIERAHGAAAKQKAKLKKQGNLITLVNGWRPEDGPFHSHIEDLKGNRLSESIEMRE